MMKCSLRLHVTTTVPGDARVDSCRGKGSKRWLRAEAAVSWVGLLTPPCSTNWSTADAAAKARYASLGFGASLEPRRAHCATRSAPTMSSVGEEEEGGAVRREKTQLCAGPLAPNCLRGSSMSAQSCARANLARASPSAPPLSPASVRITPGRARCSSQSIVAWLSPTSTCCSRSRLGPPRLSKSATPTSRARFWSTAATTVHAGGGDACGW